MSLIAIISAFLGITVIYTGFLVAANHMATGVVLSCAGILVLVKPALEAARLLGAQSSSASQSHTPRPTTRKNKTKKVYLKIVKSEDDKPTIH